MKKLLLLMLSMVLVTGCVPVEEPAEVLEEPETAENVYLDEDKGVSFEYPDGWLEYNWSEDDGITGFHKESDEIIEWETDGSLIISIQDLSEGVSLKEYLDSQYEECMAEEIPEGVEIGPVCVEIDIDSWEKVEVSGYPGYLSERRGMPNSGETAKDLFVEADGFYLNLRSVGTGLAIQENQEYIESVFDQAVDSLEIQ